jgi:hypothetical protein
MRLGRRKGGLEKKYINLKNVILNFLLTSAYIVA